jgi:N-acetylglucosaminyl-diphospho-decaprenol L-rhamnosyltransferase
MTGTLASTREPVSIVIVNWNGGTMLIDCLDSVVGLGMDLREIVLVDNASSDGSEGAAAAKYPFIRLIRNEENTGFPRACNQGVDAAAHDLIVLLNNDTIVAPGWIEGLAGMAANGDYGVVTSRVVTDGVPAEYYSMNGSINYAGYNIMRVFADLSQVFFAGGGSLMFRRSIVGAPFPDYYFLYHEDVHLSWRMRMAGRRVGMAQSSVVRHLGSVSTKRQPGELTTFYQERNRLLNALIFYAPGTLLKIAPYLAADAVAKVILSLVSGRKSARGIFRAYGWVFAHPGLVAARRREQQRMRRVPDSAIVSLMSARIVEGNGTAAWILNGLSRAYASLVRLPHHD